MASLTSTLDLGEVRGDRGDRGDLAGSVLASFSSFLATPKKTIVVVWNKQIEIPQALKIVLMNPNDSRLVEYFTTT